MASGGPILPTTRTLVNHVKKSVQRCRTPHQRAQFYLPEERPRWYIVGPGREGETEPSQWQPKWPYSIDAWRDAEDRGEQVVMPKN